MAHEQSHAGHGLQGQMSNAMQACIVNCTDCKQSCETTMMHCLQMGGRHAEADRIQVLLDCAQICETSADFMLRNSPVHPRVCAVCAEVCDRCAQVCDEFGDDEQMKACANVCRACAQSCRQMAGMAMPA